MDSLTKCISRSNSELLSTHFVLSNCNFCVRFHCQGLASRCTGLLFLWPWKAGMGLCPTPVVCPSRSQGSWARRPYGHILTHMVTALHLSFKAFPAKLLGIEHHSITNLEEPVHQDNCTNFVSAYLEKHHADWVSSLFLFFCTTQCDPNAHSKIQWE